MQITTSAIFRAKEKTTKEKKTLNMSGSSLKMSSLKLFNILVVVMLGPTNLLEFNEDITLFISAFSRV